MKTTDQILKALRITYLLYDNFREAQFQEWAKKYSREFGISLRTLVTHDGLRNWYHDQWLALVERPFVGDNSEFFSMDATGVLQEILFTYPEKLKAHYPAPLLTMIKENSNGITKDHSTRGRTACAKA